MSKQLLYSPALLIQIIIFFNHLLISQTTFHKTYGTGFNDTPRGFVQMDDGSFIVGGFTEASGGGPGFQVGYVIKIGPNGEKLWAKSYDSFAGSQADYFLSFAKTNDGGMIATGYSGPFGNPTDLDMLLVKMDADGNIMWSTRFGGGADDYGYVVEAASDGTYILAGRTYSYGPGSSESNIYIVRTNSSGIMLWSKVFDLGETDIAGDVKEMYDGNFIVTGWSYTSAKANELVLIKLDVNGNTLWAKGYGGIGNEYGYQVQQTDDNGDGVKDDGFVVSGISGSWSPPNGTNAFVLKVDRNGVSTWGRNIGGSGHDQAVGVIQLSNGSYAVAGRTPSYGAGGDDLYFIKMTGTGSVSWSRVFGGSSNERPGDRPILQTFDGGYAFVGSTQSYGSGGEDFYLIRTNSSGFTGCSEATVTSSVSNIFIGNLTPTDLIYSETTGNDQNPISYIVTDVVSGETNVCIQFSIQLISFRGAYDTENHIVRLTWETSGIEEHSLFVVERSMDGKSFQELADIAADKNMPAGIYTDVQPETGINYYRLKWADDGQEKYSSIIEVTVINSTGKEDVRIFPNPVRNRVTLTYSLAAKQEVKIHMFNYLSQKVHEINKGVLDEGTYQDLIDVNKYEAGIYFVKILSGSMEKTERLIVIE